MKTLMHNGVLKGHKVEFICSLAQIVNMKPFFQTSNLNNQNVFVFQSNQTQKNTKAGLFLFCIDGSFNIANQTMAKDDLRRNYCPFCRNVEISKKRMERKQKKSFLI